VLFRSWEDRPTARQRWFFDLLERDVTAPAFDGHFVISQLNERLVKLPGFEAEILALEQGPASGKAVHLRMIGNNWDDLTAAAVAAHDSARTKAIDNGLDQLVNAIAELAAFETRLEQVEQDVTHGRALGMTPLPTAGDVGVNEYKPRLAEAALLIAALARRMNLRLGAVERALEGRLPVGQDAAPVGEERPQSAKKPAAAKKRPAAKMKTSAKKKPAVKKTLAKKPVVKKPTTKKLVVKPPVTKTQAAKKQPAEAKQAGAAKPSEDTAPPAEKKRQAAA